MIRAAHTDDNAALMALAEATGMFEADELGSLAEMVSGYFEGSLGGDHYWVVDDDTGVVAAAYFAPEMMAHNVWNLYFIGVHPSVRRQGRAEALLHHVEDAVGNRNARLLIIETSGSDQFEPARQLYGKNGYDEEARIREFYSAGDDKVVFRKKLTD